MESLVLRFQHQILRFTINLLRYLIEKVMKSKGYETKLLRCRIIKIKRGTLHQKTNKIV